MSSDNTIATIQPAESPAEITFPLDFSISDAEREEIKERQLLQTVVERRLNYHMFNAAIKGNAEILQILDAPEDEFAFERKPLTEEICQLNIENIKLAIQLAAILGQLEYIKTQSAALAV